MSTFLVGLGGLLGAISRYLLSDWINQKWKRAFPLATLFINLSGSFLLGALTAFHLTHHSLTINNLQLFFGMGFLGAFTTFSTFIYETVNISQQKKRLGFFYSLLSLGGGLAFCWLGFSLIIKRLYLAIFQQR